MKKEKILIIKTGYSEILEGENNSRRVSLGDVLRTTPLIQIYKNKHLTWVTDLDAFPLLENNPFISRLINYDFTSSFQLMNEEFDTVINLEKIPGICALSGIIKAKKDRFGFSFNSQTGEAEAYDKAYEVLAVSSDSSAKKENKQTAQELLFKIVGKSWKMEEYSLGYKPKTTEDFDFALNTRSGLKWPTKAWSTKNWDKLENMLIDEGYKVTRQDKQGPEILNNLYIYMDWINSARTIVSIDSLGLHLGIAMKKNVVGLFGPTPNLEVYFYGRGEPIVSEAECEYIPCFKPKCISQKNCMDSINPDKVFETVRKYKSEK